MNLTQLTNSTLMAALAAAVILAVVVAGLAWFYLQRRRRTTTAGLRQRFGPEYERAIEEHGSEGRGEAHLAAREKRVEKLKIRDLDPDTREHFLGQWQALQSRFVDDPKKAIIEADALVSTVMEARGYPVADFNQRAADVSVDHPRVVANYRSAHDIASRLERDEASTEDLRTATLQYRSLFEELVQLPTVAEIKEVA